MFAYSEPKQLQNGCYAVRVTDEDGKRVLRQLNGVTLLSDFAESQVAVFDIGSCMDVIKSADEFNVESSKQNSMSWFGKELAAKTLESAYGPSVSTDGEINLQKVKGLKIYNHLKEVVDPESLAVNTKCDIIAELSSLTFSKKSFKANWKLVQVKLRAPPHTRYTDEYLFADNDQADGESESDDEMI